MKNWITAFELGRSQDFILGGMYYEIKKLKELEIVIFIRIYT